MPNEQQLITQLAQRYGVDPRAALAIASVEGGFNGSVGDNGTSFGPFQLHEGGALPRGRNSAWANSAAGINYAMQHIASVAKGLQGRQAVAAISSRFERPLDVQGEISKAMGRYGGVGGGGMQVGNPVTGGRGLSAPLGGADLSPQILALVQQVLSTNGGRQKLAPQINPNPVNYGLFNA